jgi:hypothetical protein
MSKQIVACSIVTLICAACSVPIDPALGDVVLNEAPFQRFVGPVSPSIPNRFIDKNCSDFPSQVEAQPFFIEEGGPARDPHKLDGDKDGLACEE